MQESNTRNKIIIGLVVLVVIVFTVLFFLPSKSVPATTTDQNQTGVNFPDTNFTNRVSEFFGLSDNNNTETTPTSNDTALGELLVQVWKKDTTGAKILDNGDLVFIDKASGDIIKSVSPYTTTDVIGKTKTNCFSSKFSSSGSSILFLCSDGLYLLSRASVTFIDSLTNDFYFIPNTEDFVYTSISNDGFTLYKNKAGKTSTLTDAAMRDIFILYTDDKNVYISEKPNTQTQNVFAYNFSNNNFSFVGDLYKTPVGVFPLNSIYEKCSPASTSTSICAEPKNTFGDVFSWRSGARTYTDTFAFYNSNTKNKDGDFEIEQNANPQEFDVAAIGMNELAQMIYFKNKTDSSLWITGSTKYLEGF